jgi:hypothetical protein
MMSDLSMAPILALSGIAALGAVYIWSEDPGRRARAWKLLRFLLRRPKAGRG